MATRPRFLVDLGDLKLSPAQQKEIASAIQGVVMQKLAHHFHSRPHIDLAKAPGQGGWAGAMMASSASGLAKLKKDNAWGRPGKSRGRKKRKSRT
jgi:hypothetical protein